MNSRSSSHVRAYSLKMYFEYTHLETLSARRYRTKSGSPENRSRRALDIQVAKIVGSLTGEMRQPSVQRWEYKQRARVRRSQVPFSVAGFSPGALSGNLPAA